MSSLRLLLRLLFLTALERLTEVDLVFTDLLEIAERIMSLTFCLALRFNDVF